MRPCFAQSGKRVLVLGLGRTGVATARALVAGGASVSVWDDSNPQVVEGAAPHDPVALGLAGFDLLVMSPGHYQFKDYLVVGLPLIILMWIVFTIVAPYYFRMTGLL